MSLSWDAKGTFGKRRFLSYIRVFSSWIGKCWKRLLRGGMESQSLELCPKLVDVAAEDLVLGMLVDGQTS